MTPVAARVRRVVAATLGALVGALSLVACSQPVNFSDELACGDIATEEGLQVFIESSCDVEHTAERFFHFESPFDGFNTRDIEIASVRYCLQRFLSHYDLRGGAWGPGGFDFVGVVTGFDEWNQGTRQIACVALFADGSVFPSSEPDTVSRAPVVGEVAPGRA